MVKVLKVTVFDNVFDSRNLGQSQPFQPFCLQLFCHAGSGMLITLQVLVLDPKLDCIETEWNKNHDCHKL